MKTIALIGSPRKNGNCDILVNKVIEKIDGENEVFFLNELDLRYCDACQSCQKGDCVKDDDVRNIIAKIEDADLLIFSSPIYFGQMSAQAKTIIDRFYMISQNQERSLAGTKVIQVFTQANPSEAFDSYIKSMETMPFAFMGMEVIETISAKGAAGKGEGIEEALKKIEELEI
ncbi:flavodoxin family protein [Methanobrevibacter millerae]|uniref:Multimeric flavodoxin WrbA n=1 Tax=Methanobrevibacter millerae TaxID=230361 RepID=A0A1G5X6J1_9EURY|nr:flavodoxin family protein [Methanobrevibacter millerae]SDA66011.1 Multimeric flavodoxin WrbA [Methanobrevibacter millerae]